MNCWNETRDLPVDRNEEKKKEEASFLNDRGKGSSGISAIFYYVHSRVFFSLSLSRENFEMRFKCSIFAWLQLHYDPK